MSYCVNCGVELDNTEKECPLCLVEVHNPIDPYNPNAERHFPDIPVYGFRQNHKDLVPPLALLMTVPASISIVFDLLTSGRISWSFLVTSALVLIAVLALPPLSMNMTKPKALLCVVLDYFGIILFLYAVNFWISGSWFWTVAIPLSAASGVIAIGQVSVFMFYKVRKLTIFAVATFSLGLLALYTDFLVKHHRESERVVGWSLFILLPCLTISALALVINRNARLKEHFRQRFFI